MEALNKMSWATKSPIFKDVSEISNICALSREERMKDDHSIKVYRDNLRLYEDEYEIGYIEGFKEGYIEGFKEGYIEGFMEGMEKGAREKTFSIAKEMKIFKLDKTVIVKATGLTIEEIKDL